MIVDQLIAILGYEIKGMSNLASFNRGLDEAEKNARKMATAIKELQSVAGAAAGPVDNLTKAWRRLSRAFASRSGIRNSAISPLTEVSAKAKEAESNIRNLGVRWRETMTDMRSSAKSMLTSGLFNNAVYGSINSVREGIKANAQYQRETSRETNANISLTDQSKIANEADRLTTLYPSAGFVNMMEMARQARGMMGDTDRALAILPDLAKAFVALQTAKGTDAAPQELSRLLRAIDNAGKNSAGQLGVTNTKDILAGLVRAAQIEGKELNVGDMWAFMRRAKIAGPGLSTEFLANVAPALVQDMTAPSAGTALSSAFQALVIGSKSVAGKKNIEEQERIGIRKDDKLAGADLMGTNPYEWAKQILLPALQKDGVNVNNDTALATAVAKLSSNSNATAMLTKMLQQRQQYDKTIDQYRNARGPDAANDAAAKDPFVAWKGFTESWAELAAAIKGMPEVVAGLNVLTGGIQKFATALRNDSGGAQALLAGVGAAGLFGAWKTTAAIWGLITAGTNLNAAAVALEAAAVSLGAGGAVGDLTTKSGKTGLLAKLGGFMPWLGAIAGRASLPLAAGVTAYNGLNSVPHAGIESALKNNPNLMVEMENYRRQWQGVQFESGLHRAGLGAGPKPGVLDSVISNVKAHMDKMGDTKATQTIVNDSSDRSITVNPNVQVSVQDVASAASATGKKTADAVSGALSGVNHNNHPTRTTKSPTF